MRIGIDATPLPPNPVGAGNYIVQLIRALARLESQDDFVIFAHQDGYNLINTATKLPLEWVIVPSKKPAHRLVWEQTVLPFLVRRARIDLLHSLHYTRPLLLPCPSVVTFHDMTFFLYPELHTRTKRVFFPAAIRFSGRKANALIAVSESTRRDSIRILNIPEGKIFTTPLGINSEFHPVSDAAQLAACRQNYNLPETFILYVGTVEPRKNLPLLLNAYKNLVDQGSTTSLVIVGRLGWMYEEVFVQVEALKIKEYVHFAGYVPAQDLPLIYNLAQIFVYPSIYEGFGFPPMEAMGCGTPVITSASSAMFDHVGDAGLLIPPQNEDALTQAMQALLASSEQRELLANKGLQRAAQFTWANTAKETMKVYQYVGKIEPGGK